VHRAVKTDIKNAPTRYDTDNIGIADIIDDTDNRAISSQGHSRVAYLFLDKIVLSGYAYGAPPVQLEHCN